VTVAWGIVSTARINRHFIAAAKRSARVTLTGVASRDRARAEAYALDNGLPRAYGAYEELLDDPDIEAVYISLPNSLHIEWSVRALRAGKHVLCEKPLSRRAREVEDAFSVADDSDRLLMEAFMYRHHPQTLRLKELVDGGVIGRPRLVRGAFSFTVRDAGDVRLVADLGGGSLMDVGCYCVNAARYLCGEPLSVFGEQVSAAGGVDLLFSGTMRLADDVVSAFDSSLCLPMRDELEVIGEEGSLFLDDPWHCRSPGMELRREGDLEHIAIDAVDSYLLQLDNFSDAIRGMTTPLLGREDAVAQARALEHLYRSAEERRPIVLDEGYGRNTEGDDARPRAVGAKP
jgi:xylose dehydrogenase (NAD/NADP)